MTIEEAEIEYLTSVCRETGRVIEDTEALIAQYRRRSRLRAASCSGVERGTSRAADPRFIERAIYEHKRFMKACT